MHVFSMNGASMVGALWKLFEEVECGNLIKEKVVGIIYDRFACSF